MKVSPQLGAAVLAALALAALATTSTRAHKLITSKYTYNADVFPIVRDRCGPCHVTGGAAPMSLLSYQDTVPWAESIREELTAERMPPWYVDEESAPIRGGRSLTAREIDTIVTWATGGTPEGEAAKRPAPMTVDRLGRGTARSRHRAGRRLHRARLTLRKRRRRSRSRPDGGRRAG